jgi:hypothetical protein
MDCSEGMDCPCIEKDAIRPDGDPQQWNENQGINSIGRTGNRKKN